MSVYDVAFDAAKPTSIQLSTPFNERSIEKPFSLPALSVQCRLTWLAEAAAAERPEGAAGGNCVAGRVPEIKYCPRLA